MYAEEVFSSDEAALGKLLLQQLQLDLKFSDCKTGLEPFSQCGRRQVGCGKVL